MANNSTTVANEIFRFVSVRGINTPENTPEKNGANRQNALNRRFVAWNISENDADLKTAIRNAITMHKPITPLLMIELPKLIGNAEAEALMLRSVIQFQSQSSNKMTLSDFENIYPTNLYDVYLWHRDNNNNREVSKKDFQDRIQNSLREQQLIGSQEAVGDFLKKTDYFINKLKLWENLLAEYINPTVSIFMNKLVDMIRWYWILEKLKSFKDGQEIYEAMYATVILPDGTYHFKPKVSPDSEPQIPQQPQNTDREKDIARLQDLNHAANEITNAVSVQNIDYKYAAKYCTDKEKSNSANINAIPVSTLLASRYVGALSEKTHAVIDSLRIPKGDGLDSDHAMDRIDNEKNLISDRNTKISHSPVVININGRLIQIDNMCYHFNPVEPCAPYQGPTLPKGRGLIRMPGIADLKVIKTTLLKYEKGEIAHVENILKGEIKVREFNTLKRTEETLFTEEETTTETEKETQTTDRFELEKEMSSVVKEDMKFDIGVKVTANLGPVSIDSHLDFTYGRTKDESNKTSTKSAQEMMNRALSRVIERRKTQRTVTTIIQTEDNNSHTLDNKGGADNIHGVYFWLDKYYLAKVVNYGKRLMFEFVVPEPAAFYIYSKVNKQPDENAIMKPELPSKDSLTKWLATFGKEWTEPLTSFKDITEKNYAELAAKYDAKDVTPAPPKIIVVATEVKYDRPPDTVANADDKNSYKGDYAFSLINKELKIPSGYRAKHADFSYSIPENVASFLGVHQYVAPFLSILIGNKQFQNYDDKNNFTYTPFTTPLYQIPLNIEDDFVPLSITGYGTHFVANIEIICDLTQERFDTWRKDTFNSIMSAYNKKLTEFRDWKKEQEVNAGITIQGNNPDINRKVEKEELKKHCIEMMSGQRFETFDAMRSNVPDLLYPEFSINEANSEGNYIQFFEQAFEWEQITYVFYPYFWGRKPNWIQIKSITDPDPIFSSFLQAGAARVLVPARPGFEKTVIHYFASNGKIWNGGEPPIPGDPLWVSIVDEIKEQQGQFEGGELEGVPWIYKVPTSLVYLESTKFKVEDTDVSAKYPNDLKKIDLAKTATDFS